MKGRRNPFVAREGFPFLLISAFAIVAVWHYVDPVYSLIPALVFVYLYLVFRDPLREIPAVPLGVVSPVDGVVLDVGLTDHSVFDGEAHVIIVRVNHLGTYTARCPVEGKIMDFRTEPEVDSVSRDTGGLWVRTDEDHDIVLQFTGHRFGLAPRAFLRFGERVGQGQRCAYLRLTRIAEVQLPIKGHVNVAVGQRVTAGTDVLAKLPHV